MELLLAFSVVLFIGVLLSGLAHRTLLSTAVLFLVAGFALGDGVGGVLELEPDDEIVVGLAELALFSVLYTDGMRVALGIVVGVVVPLISVLLIRSRFTSATPLYASLGGLSIGLMVLGIASVTHANLFLAAFSAGITVATADHDVKDSFAEFGELVPNC